MVWVQVDREVYARAGGAGFGLRRRGVTVPVTDCVIATAAEYTRVGILTLDGHFAHLAQETCVELREG